MKNQRVIHLQVQGEKGQATTIAVAAANRAEAVKKAAAFGWRVLAPQDRGEPSTRRLKLLHSSFRFPLLQFSHELQALLAAGLNLFAAVQTLKAKERRQQVRAVLEHVLQRLEEGKTFSDALSEEPECFPAVYVATVRAAERTGDLASALERYGGYQQQLERLRKKLVTAALYPAMLLIVGGLVTLFLLGYVVPRFSSVFEQANREIPWMSRVLLDVGQVIYRNWVCTLSLCAFWVSACVGITLHPRARVKGVDLVLRMPWLAKRAEEFRLARFFRALSLLLSSGMALTKSLEMVSGLLGARQQRLLQDVRTAVSQGKSLSNALSTSGLSNPVADSLIKVGESAGQLAEMLERTAQFHDDEFARTAEIASRLLEPTLMLVIGLVIGTIVVLLYMPIFELAGSLG